MYITSIEVFFSLLYKSQRHGKEKVAYYSSKIAKYQGIPTGNEENDNAAALTKNRFAIASFGDESQKCESAEENPSSNSSLILNGQQVKHRLLYNNL